MVRSLVVSINYALHSPVLKGLLYITILMNALVFPVQQFIPAIGRDHLGVGATLVGLLLAAEGIGQLAGAGLMSLTRSVRYHGRVFVFGSLGVMLMVLLFVWSPWYGLAFALLAIGGLGQSGFSTMQSAITMLAAPPDMRGRMMGLLSFPLPRVRGDARGGRGSRSPSAGREHNRCRDGHERSLRGPLRR